MGAETDRGLTLGGLSAADASGADAATAADGGPEPETDLEVIGLETTRELDGFLLEGPAPRPRLEG